MGSLHLTTQSTVTIYYSDHCPLAPSVGYAPSLSSDS